MKKLLALGVMMLCAAPLAAQQAPAQQTPAGVVVVAPQGVSAATAVMGPDGKIVATTSDGRTIELHATAVPATSAASVQPTQQPASQQVRTVKNADGSTTQMLVDQNGRVIAVSSPNAAPPPAEPTAPQAAEAVKNVDSPTIQTVVVQNGTPVVTTRQSADAPQSPK